MAEHGAGRVSSMRTPEEVIVELRVLYRESRRKPGDVKVPLLKAQTHPVQHGADCDD